MAARLLWICLGGALGTGARHLVSVWALRTWGPGFAWGTLIVNVAGSFLLAAIMQVGLHSSALSPTVRLTLATGVMGGFTTYSTFSYEAAGYLQAGAWGLAALYVTTTVFACLAATFLGFFAGRLVTG